MSTLGDGGGHDDTISIRITPAGGLGDAAERMAVAIPVPPPLEETLRHQRAESGDPLARSVPPHITLVPPLRVGDSDLDEVHRHLSAAAAATARFTIRLRGTDTFRPVSPVVFVPLVEGAPEVAQVEVRVRSGVLDGHRRFPFHPHVTLAQDVDDDSLDRAGAALADFDAVFTAACFVLYRRDGAGMWRPVHEYALA